MRQEIEKIIQKYSKPLYEILDNQGTIKPYCYQKAYDKEWGNFDKNSLNRAHLITAIQFHPEIEKERLENLIRTLFIEEIKARENDDFQGFGYNLQMLAQLLLEYNKEEDTALFERAKDANFDTYLGFEAEDYGYKRSFENYDLEDYIDFTYDWEEYDVMSSFIDEWIKQQTQWDEKNLNNWKYYEKRRKNLEGQAAALERLGELKVKEGNAWDICSTYKDYAEVLIDLGQYAKAWDTIKLLIPYLDDATNTNTKWYKLGLGRFIIDDCMRIIILSRNRSLFNETWKWAHPYLKKCAQNMGWCQIENCIKAARVVSDNVMAKYLSKKLNLLKHKYAFLK